MLELHPLDDHNKALGDVRAFCGEWCLEHHPAPLPPRLSVVITTPRESGMPAYTECETCGDTLIFPEDRDA